MPRSRRQRDRRPARKKPFREPRRRLLVVCEGAKTEPSYIRGLERWLRNVSLEVDIYKEHGVPRSLVDWACDRKKEAEREAKRQGDAFLGYDEVWCVYDVDEHPQLPDAQQKARAHGVELAISNPCFELWLLLHFRESPGSQTRHGMRKLLRRYIPSFEKIVQFEQLQENLGNAKNRAQRLDNEARKVDEHGRNPTTGVYRLVESMERQA